MLIDKTVSNSLILFIIVNVAVFTTGCYEVENSPGTCDDIAQVIDSLCKDHLEIDTGELEDSIACKNDKTTDCSKVVSCLEDKDICDSSLLECLYGHDYCDAHECPVAEVNCYDSEFSDGNTGFDYRAAFDDCASIHARYGSDTNYEYTAVQVCLEGKCAASKDVTKILCSK